MRKLFIRPKCFPIECPVYNKEGNVKTQIVGIRAVCFICHTSENLIELSCVLTPVSRLQSQAFYERELEAMKRTQQLTADNLLAWKRTESELRREFQTQEAALQKTLGKLRLELARVTDEARENREKSHKLQSSLHNAESNVKVSLNRDSFMETRAVDFYMCALTC